MPQDVWKCLLYFVVAWVCWTKYSVIIWQVEACLNQIQRLWTANTFKPWEQLKGKRCSPELMATGLRLYSSVYLRCFVAVLGSGPVRRLQLRAGWSCNMKRFFLQAFLHRTGSFELAAISLTFYRFCNFCNFCKIQREFLWIFEVHPTACHSLPGPEFRRVRVLKVLAVCTKKSEKAEVDIIRFLGRIWILMDSLCAEFARFCKILQHHVTVVTSFDCVSMFTYVIHPCYTYM